MAAEHLFLDAAGVQASLRADLRVIAIRALPCAELPLHLLPGGGRPQPGHWTGHDECLAVWRSPTEVLVFARSGLVADALANSLRAGVHPLACAIDRSAGLSVLELRGRAPDKLLACLIDAASIPARPGQATHARCMDITVLLVRLELDRLWLVAERPLGDYVCAGLVEVAASCGA